MAQKYAAMSDEELQKAAAPAESVGLTVWAFEALREEMRKRGLDWAGKDVQLPQDMVRFIISDDPGNRPVVLRRYRDMPAAFVEKSVLDAVGIGCFLQDDNVVRMDWLWSNAMGGIKLMVREKDAERGGTPSPSGTSKRATGNGSERHLVFSLTSSFNLKSHRSSLLGVRRLAAHFAVKASPPNAPYIACLALHVQRPPC